MVAFNNLKGYNKNNYALYVISNTIFAMLGTRPKVCQYDKLYKRKPCNTRDRLMSIDSIKY